MQSEGLNPTVKIYGAIQRENPFGIVRISRFSGKKHLSHPRRLLAINISTPHTYHVS
jgi:hypothetical protein